MTLIRVNFLFISIVLLYIYFGYHNTLANVLNLKQETKNDLEMVYNKSCLSHIDCDDHMECISSICKHKKITSTIPTATIINELPEITSFKSIMSILVFGSFTLAPIFAFIICRKNCC